MESTTKKNTERRMWFRDFEKDMFKCVSMCLKTNNNKVKILLEGQATSVETISQSQGNIFMESNKKQTT